jgi:hypothetical protein
MLRDAHAEDFERKRKPELGRDPRETKLEEDESDDESEDGDEGGGESGNDAEERNYGDDEGRNSEGEYEDDEEQSALARIREDLGVGMSGVRGVKQNAALGND